MKKNNWVKVKKDGKLPTEHSPVRILANDGNGNFNIFTAHHEHGVWFIYDPFSSIPCFRMYPRQQYVSHWKLMEDLPSKIK